MFRTLVILLISGCHFGLQSNRSGTGDRPREAFNACLTPEGRRATGTWDDPIEVAGLPFVDVGDTTDALSADAATWDCDPRVDRGGAELVYALDLRETTDLRVELTYAEGVSVMVQLLPASGAPVDGVSTGCLAAAQEVMQSDQVPAGEWRLVVDTVRSPSGAALPGAYTMTVDVMTRGVWQDVRLGEGFTWRRFRGERSDALTWEMFNAFVIDLGGNEVVPSPHGSCVSVLQRGEDIGARAGVSGGFAGTSCESLDLVRGDGETYSTNTYAPQQRVLGWDDGGVPSLEWVARGADWTGADNAVGSFPSLVDGGLVTLEPAGSDELYTSTQARVAAGVTADDELVFLVADGGGTDVPGLALDELAAAMVELGAVEAINLGGGSGATAWVDGCSATGIVSWPAGGAVHDDAGGAPDGIYVF